MSKSHNTETIQVRLLNSKADIEATWSLSLALHNESRYAVLRPNKERMANYLRENAIGKPDRFGFIIAEWKGKPVGYLGCAANQFLYGEEIVSSCLSFYVSQQYRKTLLGGRIAVKLLTAYRLWAINRRAVELQLHVTSGIGINRTDKFLRHAGFHQVGGNYSIALASPKQPITTNSEE